MKIVTFNIRSVWCGACDGINSFVHRAGLVLNTIDEKMPDVICFQEVVPQIDAFLKKHMNREYRYLYHGRNADLGGEGLVVAYRAEKLELLNMACEWMSPTPFVPGSRFPEQSECPRILMTYEFRELASKKLFRVYNTHLDHISDSARVLGIKQTVETMKRDQDRMTMPVFLMGDFNALPDSETIRYTNENTVFPMVDLTTAFTGTYHGFGKYSENKIDYIYTDPETAKKEHAAALWDEQVNGIYLSDHYPVELTIEL